MGKLDLVNRPVILACPLHIIQILLNNDTQTHTITHTHSQSQNYTYMYIPEIQIYTHTASHIKSPRRLHICDMCDINIPRYIHIHIKQQNY